MKFFSGILSAIIVLAAVAFAVANRQPVMLSLWPFDAETPPVFVGLLVLGAFLFGLLVGGMAVWIGMIPHRLRSRKAHKDLAALHEKVADLQKTVDSTSAMQKESGSDFLLAPPKLKWPLWRSRA